MSRPDLRTTTPEDAARVEAHQHSREPRLPDVYADDLIPAEPHLWHEPGTCPGCDVARAVTAAVAAARGGAS